jgi:hypothetical protein
MNQTLSRREMVLAGAILTVLAGLVFGPLVIHGGFHLDDWSNGAEALYPPPGANGFSRISEVALFRPVLILYVPLTYFIFGMHMWLHLLWSVALGVAVSTLLYAVLRTLGVPWLHAGFIAALVLLFPWFDGIRYWVTGAQVSLSITVMLFGLLIALRVLSKDTKWHLVAAAIYLISILTYEITLPLIAGLGAIYAFRVGWRRARARWAMDIVAVVLGGVWVASHTERTKSGISGDLSHLGEIIKGGAEILGRTAIPVGGAHTTPVLILLAVIFGSGIAAYLARPKAANESAWGLRNWLLLAAGGAGVVVLGWTIFIPADPYYTPVIWGLTNRVNGLAGIGLVIVVYAAFGVLATLIGQISRRVDAVAIAVACCLALLVGAGYITVLREHTGIWNSAYVAEQSAIDDIHERYPQMPHGTTLFASGYPAYQTLGVPILSSTWDLRGMVQDLYEDGTLNAYPIIEGLSIGCVEEGVVLEGEGAPETVARYGTARLFDLATGKSSMPLSLRECRAVAGNYRPGPFYLSYDY